MLIGIISPTYMELQPFLKVLEDVKEYQSGMTKMYSGTYKGLEIACVRSGMGKVNAAVATQKLIDTFKMDFLILSGVAGAIDPSLRIGDVVINDKVAYHDVDNQMVLIDSYPKMKDQWFYSDKKLLKIFDTVITEIKDKEDFKYEVLTGLGVTGEQFITEDGRDDIIERFHPMSVDMETGAIAHVAYINEVSFASIRSITDTPFDSGFGTFLENVEVASENAVSVLEMFLDTISEQQIGIFVFGD
jgi:adenosylhomocysteine nucleosidase